MWVDSTHLTGKRGETEILREIERHYQQYFVQVPGQSRLWHRIRQALPLIEGFRRYLRDQLGVALEEIRILDSCPIPVALPNSRPGRGNGFDLADGGYGRTARNRGRKRNRQDLHD